MVCKEHHYTFGFQEDFSGWVELGAEMKIIREMYKKRSSKMVLQEEEIGIVKSSKQK